MNKEIDQVQEKVLKTYCRSIVHMRQEIDNNRFGLIFGAGVSTQFKFPLWNELIKRIAKHKDVDAEAILSKSLDNTITSQLLFQQYRLKQKNKNEMQKDKNEKDKDLAYNKFEMRVKAGWHKIVHDVLYEGVPPDINELKKSDKYISNYMEIMKKTRVTINYNFDDTIERLLEFSRKDSEKSEIRGYKTIWTPNIPLIPDTSIIYHPNGFIPRRLVDQPSTDLIFLEDSFEDRLMEGISGHYDFLNNHLSQMTCLFIGHSLKDPTLKHLLRRNVLRHPGQYHYFIKHVDSSSDIDETQKSIHNSIYDSNFEIYNLITLFLSKEEIAALGTLLNMNEDDFQPYVEDHDGNNVYRYYITGSVCVGKSTLVSHFKNLTTHDEWLDPFPECMGKDPSKVSKEGVKEIDEWIASQVSQKNIVLIRQRSGIHIIDRAPLDAFAFTNKDKWIEKANILKSHINPVKKDARKLQPAHIIFLKGDPNVMAVRAITCHRDYDAEGLQLQQELLEVVYKMKGVTEIDTRDKNISQVVKEVAGIIHCKPYEEAPIQERLDQLEKEGIPK